MEECLPRMTKTRRELRSSDDRVVAARQEVELAQTRYENSNQEADKELWTEAVHNLYQTYKLVEEEELASQIQIIEAAHGEQKHRVAWMAVNSITGRKKPKEGQVAGSSPEERVNTWFTHFQKLLGNPPEACLSTLRTFPRYTLQTAQN